MPEQMTDIMHSDLFLKNNCCIFTYMSLQLIHRSHVEDKNSTYFIKSTGPNDRRAKQAP